MSRHPRSARVSHRLAWLGLAAVLAAPLAQAADGCVAPLGRGWPPATENHGSAVEQLLAGKAEPRLSLTVLPTRATENGLLLIPGAGADADWTLRHAVPNERVQVWSRSRGGGALELRVDQEIDSEDAPMPAALAQRLVAAWKRALEQAVPADKPAEYRDADQLLFVVDGVRVSGARPDCGVGETLMEQATLLTEAAGASANKRERRWRDLNESLDELDKQLQAPPAP
ncbi:hypothetical protein [Lysobacter enzymogenes]|uniref:hypothetical protein n=1 Tax=Lysobacter enzymogenes TaxID=69 RepID=UPI001A96DA06|nr:hypothetical protein [Lysobacter enzymogenes]QQP95501.1 hypothetical protein JHW38_20020 [Lysobacter enzymogenes]